MNKQTILITVGSLVFLFAFMFAAYALTNKTADYKEIMNISKDDHVKWSPSRKHVLVEYSDFQCPACRAFHELLTSFESTTSANADIPKKVTLVFRHFPLYQIHENAYETAYAVEAAGEQGKFFEMAGAVFKDQAKLTDNPDTKKFLLNKAKEVGLNADKLLKDMEDKKVQSKVQNDLAAGERASINATPTFFLDGQKLEFQSVEEFVNTLKNLK